MDIKARILWITRTALFLALLIAAQALSGALGQYITGSLVNFILISAALLGGAASGITVALLSPLFAFMLGIGPALPPVLPFVMLGNLTIVLVWHFITRNSEGKAFWLRGILALVIGATAKFLVLYLGIARFLVPVLLNLPDAQSALLTASFSLPQLFTALLGGTLALLVVPPVRMALRRSRL